MYTPTKPNEPNELDELDEQNIRLNRMLGAALTVLTMLALKQFYSQAGADQLAWMLAPTARLTAWLNQAQPVWESGAGYVDFARGIIIAPGCAGINFLIMAFGLAACCGLPHLRQLPHVLAWLAISLAGAYVAALVVNTVRIILSMYLYQADIYGGPLTLERVHRVIGTGIYMGALGLFFWGLQPIISRYCKRMAGCTVPAGPPLPLWFPLGWYVIGAVGVPVVNLLFRRPSDQFVEHCATVVPAALLAWAGAMGVRHIVRGVLDAGKNTYRGR